MNFTLTGAGKRISLFFLAGIICFCFNSCGIYTFKDASVPDYVKTIKINFIENHAGIVNPQLGPKLTDQFKTKVSSYLRKASLVNNDNADYIITAYVSNYTVSTSAISSQVAATNRLTVAVHIELNNTVKGIVTPYDVTHDFDFPATQTLIAEEASASFMDNIITNLSDEMFNDIFSSW